MSLTFMPCIHMVQSIVPLLRSSFTALAGITVARKHGRDRTGLACSPALRAAKTYHGWRINAQSSTHTHLRARSLGLLREQHNSIAYLRINQRQRGPVQVRHVFLVFGFPVYQVAQIFQRFNADAGAVFPDML